MKILMLLENEFPPDERVEKEIHTLAEQGHDLQIVCITRKNRPRLEKADEFVIHRIKVSRLMHKLSAVILILPFYRNMWYRIVLSLHKKYSFDTIHVHDLPLSMIGMKLKKKYGVNLICDQHEYYSNWIVDTAHYNTFIGKIAKRFSNWKKYERKALNMADHIITVEQPLKEIYLQEYQLEPKKITVLSNTPNKSHFQESSVDPELYEKYKDHFMLLYFGGIDILRGIDYVINAIPEIIKVIPNFKFVLAGTIRKDYDPFINARNLGVEEYVDYIGWIDRKNLASLIHYSDLGVFTPVSDRVEINKTIATKLYQFLVMNKPFMVGKAQYMKEFAENNRVGFSVDECQASELSKGVVSYYQDEAKRAEMIENCKKIGSDYYWEHTSKSLIDCYRFLGE